MPEFDTIIVGSGINSLVCAALQAEHGYKVCVLERSDTLGGCIRTEELTQPGYRHDTLSTLYPLFVSAPHYPWLAEPLAQQGVEFVNTQWPTGVVMPGDHTAVLSRNRERNVEELDKLAPGDGQSYAQALADLERSAALTFTLLGSELRTGTITRALLRYLWCHGMVELVEYARSGLMSCRAWLATTFRSEITRALIAPWVLHVGLGPESAASALMARVTLLTLEASGSPMVRGGSSALVNAFVRLIEMHGGQVHHSADVDQILVTNGVARGVMLQDGRQFHARRAVVCNATPQQLYGRLLRTARVDEKLRTMSTRYRFGRGEMQIHLALDHPPVWRDPRLSNVAMLHVTSGLNAVSRSVNEAERGLLPADGTIVVAQPTALDPSRAPPGKAILWIQLQELPSVVRGDAAGILNTPTDGQWTPALRERYAERIVARLGEFIPDLTTHIAGRAVLSPADLESLNINLTGGDPYSGDCSLDQFLWWRPSRAGSSHRTGIKRLFHIGASTHPGPGLGGMSGYLTAMQLV